MINWIKNYIIMVTKLKSTIENLKANSILKIIEKFWFDYQSDNSQKKWFWFRRENNLINCLIWKRHLIKLLFELILRIKQ